MQIYTSPQVGLWHVPHFLQSQSKYNKESNGSALCSWVLCFSDLCMAYLCAFCCWLLMISRSAWETVRFCYFAAYLLVSVSTTRFELLNHAKFIEIREVGSFIYMNLVTGRMWRIQQHWCLEYVLLQHSSNAKEKLYLFEWRKTEIYIIQTKWLHISFNVVFLFIYVRKAHYGSSISKHAVAEIPRKYFQQICISTTSQFLITASKFHGHEDISLLFHALLVRLAPKRQNKSLKVTGAWVKFENYYLETLSVPPVTSHP
jgi:hypothetical protein